MSAASGIAVARRILPRVPAYAKLTALTIETIFAYRFNVAFEAVGLLLQILLLRVVWTAVYADRGVVEGADLPTLLTYLTIANLQVWIVWPETTWFLQRKVREGRIAQDLARPVGLVEQLLAHQVGSTAFFLLMGIVLLPAAFFVGVLRPPASMDAALLYVASLVLAVGVVTWIGLLMGAVAFWTLETSGIQQIYRFANLFFAGGLVPLWFFPGPLRAVAELLPFQTQANIPVSIYVGRLAGTEALRGLAVQAVWIVLLGLLMRIVWARAMRRVVIQGG